MKKAIIFGILISVILISCSKSSSPWVGTYNGTGVSNTVNRVVINSASSNTLQIQLQGLYLGAYYTYATIQHAAVTSSTTATVNEDGLIYGNTATYHFIGTAVLSGNSVTISGSGTNTTNSSDVKYYYFTGSK